MNKRIKKKQIKMRNKKLCKRYPFLKPRSWHDDVVVWEHRKTDWRYCKPYSFTELDALPSGWRRAFGIQMCEEIRDELIKYNCLDKYRIAQIKEKYGSLRWYDWGRPRESKISEIIQKYEDISIHTCIRCGRPATKISLGWISPWCDKCASKLNMKFENIEDSEWT